MPTLQQALQATKKQLGEGLSANVYDGGYSGRAMYGRQCPAITGSMKACQIFLMEMIKEAQHDVNEAFRDAGDDLTDNELYALDLKAKALDDLVEAVLSFTTDSFGYDIVMYWPGETYVEQEEEQADGQEG